MTLETWETNFSAQDAKIMVATSRALNFAHSPGTCLEDQGPDGVEKFLGFKMPDSERGLNYTLSMASLVGVIYTLLSSRHSPHSSSEALNGLQLGRERSPRMSVNPHLNYSTRTSGSE